MSLEDQNPWIPFLMSDTLTSPPCTNLLWWPWLLISAWEHCQVLIQNSHSKAAEHKSQSYWAGILRVQMVAATFLTKLSRWSFMETNFFFLTLFYFTIQYGNSLWPFLLPSPPPPPPPTTCLSFVEEADHLTGQHSLRKASNEGLPILAWGDRRAGSEFPEGRDGSLN